MKLKSLLIIAMYICSLFLVERNPLCNLQHYGVGKDSASSLY